MSGWRGLFAVILALVVLAGFIMFVRETSQCNDAGGEMVRTMSGTYKCVEGKEVFIR